MCFSDLLKVVLKYLTLKKCIIVKIREQLGQLFTL